MSAIPDEIMDEAEKTLDLILCNCSVGDRDARADSIMDIAKALLAAEQRGAEGGRERCTSAAKSLAAGFAVKAQNPSIGEDEARLLAIHADAFTDFAQMLAAIRNTKE